MRKKVAKWLIGILVGTITVLSHLLLYYTYLFSPLIISLANKHLLGESNIRLSGSLYGNLIHQSAGIADLVISVNDYSDTLFTSQRLTVNGWEFDFESSHFIAERIRIDNYHLYTTVLQQLGKSVNETSRSSPLSLTINNLIAGDGRLESRWIDSSGVVEIDELSGNIWLIDGHLGSDFTAILPHAPIPGMDSVRISGLLGRSRGGLIHFDDFAIFDSETYLDLNGTLEGNLISTQFRAHQYDLKGLENDLQMPESLRDGSADLDIQVEHDLAVNRTSIQGIGTIHLPGNDYPISISRADYFNNEIDLEMKVGTDLNFTQVSATYSKDGVISADIHLFRPHINKLITDDRLKIFEPIGTVSIRGTRERFRVQTDIDSFTFNEITFNTLNTMLDIDTNSGVSVSDGSLTQGPNTLNFAGFVSKDSLDLSGILNISDLSFLQSMTSNSALEGSFVSNFNIEGDLRNPRFRGHLFPENLGLKKLLRVNGTGKYDIFITAGLLRGNLALQGQKGFLMGDSLVSYDLLTNFSDRKLEIEEMHVQGQNNLVSMSGLLSRGRAALHKLNVIVGEDQLKLIDSVQVSRSSDSTFHIPPTLLTFNLSGISLGGSYHPVRGLNIESRFEMFNFGDFVRFAKIPVTFEGMATGDAQISGNLTNPEIRTQFRLLEGNSIGYPTDTTRVDLTIRSDATISHMIDAKRAGGKLSLTGQLPWGYGLSKESLQQTNQNFSIQVDNYRLKDINLTQIVGQPISGRASGSITFRGTPLRTKMDAQLQLRNAKFDTLDFNSVYANFEYEDNLWTFDSLSTISNWGYGSGVGSMPISLDMIAKDRSSVIDRELNMDFNFVLNRMPFLTSYIDALDVIEGDIQADLSFSGPMRAPLRNGKVRAHNGRLQVSILGNPITNIHSELTLVDNTMTIDHFSGRMRFTQGSALNIQGVVGRATAFISDLIGVAAAIGYAGEVSASGEIDFTSFFRPKFDVNVAANEVYYRSSDGLIEAIADATLDFTGQDTLDIQAVIPVKRAVYYDNFTSGASYYDEIGGVDSSLFRYSIQTQFASDLFISNDQLEAEFEGELWLLDYGDGEMHFSGTLNALEGGKFYYLGNELTIVSGEIIFQSVDFNPQINIEAEIEIEGELVSLALTGDLLEPELRIDAGTTQLSQNDVLTYLTINQKLVEVSFEDGSALNPVETYSEMLVEKQISKIGREITGLDILTISGVNISGSKIGFGSDTTDTPRFQVGQRLSKNLKVTYEGALQPTGGKTDYDFGLEYQINRKLSVNSKVNQDGEVELNGRLKFTY
ncbi:MAG: translocation/assembly module TamB domain-containing protein [Candidatus Marinimicrobia bacterium]|nr:translocation/assembly module TamB domain-containing protein [Candidatus Neomarinimicrobiota bacterium]MCF7904559.1 translocation/assembly module TamB domain-containing protein [Candidatus Neomarinimicrobiota bacterium]